jgi:4'-phosphopantetheinyl transferase
LQPEVDLPLAILSPDELERGRRFLREEHQRRFCLARAFLRWILSRYLPIAPEELQFRKGPHGKLYLAQNAGIPIQFNMSHSRDLALYAVILDREIGIDVEWMDADLLVQPLAARYLTPSQYREFLATPDQAIQRSAAFYRLWTRKEAYLKALGLGLSGLSQAGEREEIDGFVADLDPGPGYAAAWALTGSVEVVPQTVCWAANPKC